MNALPKYVDFLNPAAAPVSWDEPQIYATVETSVPLPLLGGTCADLEVRLTVYRDGGRPFEVEKVEVQVFLDNDPKRPAWVEVNDDRAGMRTTLEGLCERAVCLALESDASLCERIEDTLAKAEEEAGQ